MLRLLRRYIAICFFRRGPQDLPASPLLPWITLVFYFAVGLLFLWLDQRRPWQLLLWRIALEAALVFTLSWALLRLWKKDARFSQTVSALLATDAFISLVAFGFLEWLAAPNRQRLIQILLNLLLLWRLAVNSHIFRHALSIGLGFAGIMAVLYTVAGQLVLRFLGIAG